MIPRATHSGGSGKYQYRNGDVYEGQWKKFKHEGQSTFTHTMERQGTLTYSTGGKYEGQFKDGEKEGQGTYTALNGNVYTGQYKSGRCDGQGTFTWGGEANGAIYQGQFKDDLFPEPGDSFDKMLAAETAGDKNALA